MIRKFATDYGFRLHPHQVGLACSDFGSKVRHRHGLFELFRISLDTWLIFMADRAVNLGRWSPTCSEGHANRNFRCVSTSHGVSFQGGPMRTYSRIGVQPSNVQIHDRFLPASSCTVEGVMR